MATNSMLTASPMRQVSSTKRKKAAPGPKIEVTPKDTAYERNMTKAGKPRLNAVSTSSGTGEGAMGQRR